MRLPTETKAELVKTLLLFRAGFYDGKKHPDFWGDFIDENHPIPDVDKENDPTGMSYIDLQVECEQWGDFLMDELQGFDFVQSLLPKSKNDKERFSKEFWAEEDKIYEQVFKLAIDFFRSLSFGAIQSAEKEAQRIGMIEKERMI